jgi:hypothetical protein
MTIGQIIEEMMRTGLLKNVAPCIQGTTNKVPPIVIKTKDRSSDVLIKK